MERPVQLDDTRMAAMLVTRAKQRQRRLLYVRVLNLRETNIRATTSAICAARKIAITDLALVDQVLLIGHLYSEDLAIWPRTSSNAS